MNLLKEVPAGDRPPELINVVIEVNSGNRDKYEYRPEWEAFLLDRVLYSPVVFPVEYGFIPRTWYDDNDPLDVMLLSYESLEIGCIVKARVIGALVMEDEQGDDPKILSVPTGDPRFADFKDLCHVVPHRLKEIEEFFEIYKRLEPRKFVKVKCWKEAKEAMEIVNYAMNKFTKEVK
jgi:inorganic pyrophosphatase